MSEWWTYSLSDFLMFSARTYYRLFELYNLAIWPGHLLAVAVALAVIACSIRGGTSAGRIAAVLLAACWLWVAWAFFAKRYATVNSAAMYFAAGFAIEALLLLWMGVRGGMVLARAHGGVSRVAFGVMLFAMFGYPLLAPASGRAWRHTELFGVAPDPTALATLGLLVLAQRTPTLLLPIPLLLSATSSATLWTMHSPDAWVAALGALLVMVLCAIKGRARSRH
jgi:hypothetical protein